jgi:hypothetical protein
MGSVESRRSKVESRRSGAKAVWFALAGIEIVEGVEFFFASRGRGVSAWEARC